MEISMQSPSIPLDLRAELQDPLSPLGISPRIFAEMQNQGSCKYKKVQVLPTDPEWRFVWRYFHYDKPNNYGIKRVYCIHKRQQLETFESNISSTELEADKFKPNWQNEPYPDQREAVIKRWQQITNAFSPFQTIEKDGRRNTWEKTKILPFWHGSSSELCDSISESGFVYFGKTSIGQKQLNDPKSTDEGFFGSGIYFTNSARYSSDIYSKGHILLAWISMREPFPVVGDATQTDMKVLKGKGAYKNYNAHYIPVRPVSSNLNCPVYHPCKEGEHPTCDEIVVFHKSQTLPRFWVELTLEAPNLKTLSDAPQFVEDLIPHIFKMLQNPLVDKDKKLRNVLNTELAILLKQAGDDDLEEKQEVFFKQLTQLIDQTGKTNKIARDSLIQNSPSQSSKQTANLLKIKNPKAILKELKEIQIKEFIEAISNEPSNGAIYSNLGRILSSKETITFSDGTKMTQKDLFLKAISLDANDSMAYTGLGHILPSKRIVTLLDGTKMTQKDLYLKAISLDANDSYAYYNLGAILSPNETVTLLDSTKMTKKDLFLKAISLNANDSRAYNNLGLILSSNEIVTLLDGTKMTKKDLYLKAISLDANNSCPYSNLGAILSSKETVTLLDGTKMTQKNLFLKAISLNANDYYAYSNLGAILSSKEAVTLFDGTKMTKKDLYLKTISLNANYLNAYNHLGNILSSKETVTLLNGTKMTKKDLYLKAISLNANNSLAYNNLALILSSKETVTLLDGTKMTQKDLFLKAISLDANYSEAYNNLGAILSPKETVALLDGTKMIKKDLYLKAISLDPSNSYAYSNLATILSPNETVTLLDGTKMTKKDLYLKAISLDANNSLAYYNLAAILSPNEIVTLLDGTRMNKQDLLNTYNKLK